ncbi:ARL14 effector protein [Frankliniella fusca]|uniref:ARL14 effector protein n=1 Tax=Frankliniella fusca TaxID=407009 RepID=A0AAE1HTW1_9NEOP|nr:ARL14 effector protein [Frankliniella fusca]
MSKDCQRMSCSIGLGDSASCHDERFTKKDFTTEEWNLILIRSRSSLVSTVCLNHKLKYLNSFTSRHAKCCDPYECHKQKVAGVSVINLEQYYKVMKLQCEFKESILPGYTLCKRCYSRLSETIKDVVLDESEASPPSTQSSLSQETRDFVHEIIQEAGSIQNIIMPSAPENVVLDSSLSTPSSSQTDLLLKEAGSIANVIFGPVLEEQLGEISQDLFADEDEVQASSLLTDTTLSGKTVSKDGDDDDDYVPSPRDAVIEQINASLVPLGESPVIKRKLTSPGPYGQSKLLKINEKIETLMTSAGGSPPDKTFEELFYEKTLSALKEKFQNSSTTKDKIGVLSIALVSLSQRTVLDEFGPLGATHYMIKKTAKLVGEQGLLPTPQPKMGCSLPVDTVQLVTNFYEDDEVSSRQMPGKKDFVSVKEGNTRVHKQKRLILCTLKELYVHFKERFPSVKIGFSTFAKLRPKHCVLADASGTHSVCVCKYHQNFKLLIESASFHQFDDKLKNYTDFISAVICEEPAPECYLKNCSNCPGTEALEIKLKNMLSDNFVESITYQQWTSTDRCSLETCVKESDEFVQMFIEQLKTLLTHHFMAKEQAKYFQSVKENLKEGEALTICDFAENYTCVVQDAVQNYYWSNDQVTIHPFVTYYRENEALKTLSFAIISDHMKHDINSVYEFQKNYVEFLKVKLPSLKKVIYFSDGAAQQYKNKKNVLNISYHVEDFGLEAEWHYFATSHGKGPCDGLGGTMKRQAYLASIRNHLIRTPSEFYNWVEKNMEKIQVKFVTSEEVKSTEDKLRQRYARALSIPQMRSQHAVLPICPSEVRTKFHSSSNDEQFVIVELVRKYLSFELLAPNQFVTIYADKKNWSLGEITLTDPDSKQVMVSLMEGTGTNTFKFGEEDEPSCYDATDILCLVHPTPSSSGFVMNTIDTVRTMWQHKSHTDELNKNN